MPFSSGTYSLYTPGNPVVTGTTISSSAFNNTMNDIATALSTCVLKDGSQTITANLPMSGFKFTGLGAGSQNGDSVRWQQSAAGVLTTTGDTLYASSANTPARLAIGAAGAIYMVNAGATAPSWLAIGTARQQLAVNSGATAVEYVASLQSLMTGTGDLVQSSGANTPARLAIGTAGQVLNVNSGATAAAWSDRVTVTSSQATTSGTSWDFTSISSWVTNIVVMFAGFSTNGTSIPIIQLGSSGTPVATGYLCTGSSSAGGNTIGTANHTTGFGIGSQWAATYIAHGSIHLTRLSAASFIWTADGKLGQSEVAQWNSTTGSKTLAAALDMVRITMTNGTDAGDAGTVAIMYW